MSKIKEIKSSINIMNSIHSLYILKEIFSLLDKRRKLNIIINNKKFQKDFGLNIEDYKKISGKYK